MEKDIKIAMETLKQIIDLVIVPNIDQHPEMAFNQMKILQLLTDLKSDSNSAPEDGDKPISIIPTHTWVKKPIKDLNDKSLKEGDYVKYDFEVYIFKCWGYDSAILIDMAGNEKEIPWY